MLATIARFPAAWRAALIVALVVTSPALTLFAAVGLVDHIALLIPGLALTALVVGTQLAAPALTVGVGE